MLTISFWHSPSPGKVQAFDLQLPEGAKLQDALQAAQWPLDGIYGVWAKVTGLEQHLQDGDRVERYRPLTVDPKVARRQRFKQQGARASGLFAKRRPNSKAGY